VAVYGALDGGLHARGRGGGPPPYEVRVRISVRVRVRVRVRVTANPKQVIIVAERGEAELAHFLRPGS